jgi:predicted nucleic acid-binding protein
VLGVTLDTNIYVSALEFGGVGASLLGMARAGMFRIDVSDAILDELLTVLRDDFRRDGYRLHFGREKITNMANRVVPRQRLDISRKTRTTTAFWSARSRRNPTFAALAITATCES